jgi:transposase
MRLYQAQHRSYCGIDLHARTMDLCLQDQQGSVLFHTDLPAQPTAFLDAVAPFRDGWVVAGECMFAWYWLADLCADQGIPFVLGHALEMRAIHGTKTQNDRRDAEKIAHVLRCGLWPQAYVYPRTLRATRDRLRRRSYLVRRRGELLAHLQIINSQYNRPPFPKKLSDAGHRPGTLERFADPAVQQTAAVDRAVIDHLDGPIADLELFLTAQAKVHDRPTCYRLRSIPGVGKVLALTLLYEIHDIRRFDEVGQFLSYARLARPAKESAGQRTGMSNRRLGNAHRKWAFSAAACLMLRSGPEVKADVARTERTHGTAQALSILAARRGRAVYLMLRRGAPFDPEVFLKPCDHAFGPGEPGV